MVQIIIMMLPLSAFSYDELSKWDRYAFSLPLSRRAVAGARYLFALILTLFAALFGLVTCLILSLAFHDSKLVENCMTVMVSLGLGLLYCDILLPLTYKLGPERARPYFYLVIFLPIILLVGASKLGLLDGLSFLEQIPEASAIAFVLLLPFLPLLGMGVSYLISCRILEHKEF